MKKLANKYNFEVQYVTKDILKLDANGRCSNPKCKCRKISCNNLLQNKI